MMADATSMQAAMRDGPSQPFRVTSVARPKSAPGQVLVRVKASGVNPLDTKIRADQAAHAHHALPAILGLDLAGTVEAVGPDVSAFRRGDEVYGMTGGVGGVVPRSELFRRVHAAAAIVRRRPGASRRYLEGGNPPDRSRPTAASPRPAQVRPGKRCRGACGSGRSIGGREDRGRYRRMNGRSSSPAMMAMM
jgi:hypothetical protein